MTAISSAIPTVILPNPTIPAITPSGDVASKIGAGSQSPSSNANNAFGPAVNVTLSAPAKAIANGHNTPAQQSSPLNDTDASSHASNTTTSSPASNASSQNTKAAPTGGGATIAYDSTAAAIASSVRKVSAQVGVADASQLVDKKGNIDKVRLAEVLAEQQKQTSQA